MPSLSLRRNFKVLSTVEVTKLRVVRNVDQIGAGVMGSAFGRALIVLIQSQFIRKRNTRQFSELIFILQLPSVSRMQISEILNHFVFVDLNRQHN